MRKTGFVVQDLTEGRAEKQEDLMMSANKESCFKGEASNYILIKDYKTKCFVIGITRTVTTAC